MQPRLLATMVTTTSYGSWLPGDIRGYVDNGIILPGDPARLERATQRMAGRSPVLFTPDQQLKLFDTLCAACHEFGYELTDASAELWHMHWMCHHGFDSVATMVGRLKTRMRQALDIGRIWTEGILRFKMFRVPNDRNPKPLHRPPHRLPNDRRKAHHARMPMTLDSFRYPRPPAG